MDITVFSKFVIVGNKYRVNWGTTGKEFNRNNKFFLKRARALLYAKTLKNKYKNKYKIRYTYVSD